MKRLILSLIVLFFAGSAYCTDEKERITPENFQQIHQKICGEISKEARKNLADAGLTDEDKKEMER